MNTRERSKRSLSMFAVLVLMFGLVAPGVAAADDLVEAPIGVWSGPGDNTGNYALVVIMDGPVGEQPAFWMQDMTIACGGAAYIFGVAEYHSGSDLVIIGDFVCAETGDLKFHDVELFFGGGHLPEYIDPDGATEGNNYPGVWLRRCAGANSTLVGTPGDDLLVGTAGNDVIDGLGGNDTLKGLGGIDILCGQGGNDTLKGGNGIDVLIGGSGKDKLRGGSSLDVLLGGGGKDNLKGQGGNDFMFGDAKKDKLTGGGGADYANGGAGSDTCSAETRVSC